MDVIPVNKSVGAALNEPSAYLRQTIEFPRTGQLIGDLPVSESDRRTDRAASRSVATSSTRVRCPCVAKTAGRSGNNAARERCRVRTLRAAFLELQRTLPTVPRDTKLSKLDVLVLATTYIAHLTSALATAPSPRVPAHSEASVMYFLTACTFSLCFCTHHKTF